MSKLTFIKRKQTQLSILSFILIALISGCETNSQPLPSPNETITNTSGTNTNTNTKPAEEKQNNETTSTIKGITTDQLNMREGAGIDHEIILSLPKGQKLIILQQENSWLYVSTGSQRGWVHSNWVKIGDELLTPSEKPTKIETPIIDNESTPNTPINETTISRTGYTLEDLNLRTGASLDYDIVTVLKRGQMITILSEHGEWLNIQVGPQIGWVHSKWISDSTTRDFNGHEEMNTLIAMASSTYPTEQTKRAENVQIAAHRISGTIIQPGDSFSFTQLAGPVNMSNGYQNATVFLSGQVSDAIGGGICQVSSTIYWAQLRAGILPTERKNHSRAVGYVPLGLDATMWEGSIDYRFTNTLNYPIYLFVEAVNGQLTVEFWSSANALNGYIFEPKTQLVSSTATTQTYQTFLQTFKDGNLVSEIYLDQSTYIIK